MNLVIMMGRLTKDPEVRYSAGQSGTTIANFRIAVDRRFKREGQPDADFFDCVTFGKQAEFVERYLHKGTKVVINGSMQNDNYEGRDGQMVYRNRIYLDNVEFAESKAASSGQGQQAGGQAGGQAGAPRQQSGGRAQNGGRPQSGARQNTRQSAPAPAPAYDGGGDGFMNIPDGIDEELPFV